MAYIRDDGQPEVIPNCTGREKLLRPLFYLTKTRRVVGEGAKQQSLLDPEDYAAFTKRHMGERDYVMTTKSGDTYTPEALSAIVLKRLKQDAESISGRYPLKELSSQCRHILTRRSAWRPCMPGKLPV